MAKNMNRGAPAGPTAMAAALHRAARAGTVGPVARVPAVNTSPKTGDDKTTTDDTPAKNSTGDPKPPTSHNVKDEGTDEGKDGDEKDGVKVEDGLHSMLETVFG